jgi:hypothetical protein
MVRARQSMVLKGPAPAVDASEQTPEPPSLCVVTLEPNTAQAP